MSRNKTLIVGLGNRGDRYIGTRHNIGFAAIDLLVETLVQTLVGAPRWRHEKKFDIAITGSAIQPVILLKPMQYMNLSGEAVRQVSDYYKILPENIIVLHDEVDLKPGVAKTKMGGGSAGHKGIISCVNQLGTGDFWRIRIGCGRPIPEMSVSDHVLARPNEEDHAEISQAVEAVVDALKNYAASGASFQVHTGKQSA